MFAHSKHTIVSAGLAGILALGVCGCSCSTETKTTVETEVTDESGKTTQTSTTTTTTNSNGSATTTTETSTDVTVDINSWTDAWEGTTDKGATVFYAQSPADVSQALIAVYDPAEDALSASLIGKATINEDKTAITITDAGGSDLAFTIIIESQGENDSASLDLGDTYGKVTVNKVDMATLVADLKKADTKGVFLS